jgi:hypothetical protein
MTTHFHDLNCIEFANDVPCTLCLGGPTMYVGSVPDVESGPSLSDRPEPNALMHLCQRCSDSIDEQAEREREEFFRYLDAAPSLDAPLASATLHDCDPASTRCWC